MDKHKEEIIDIINNILTDIKYYRKDEISVNLDKIIKKNNIVTMNYREFCKNKLLKIN